MKVHVANRSPVPASPLVDRSCALNDLDAFWRSADFFVVSVPSNAETAGIVNAASFAAMRESAVILNVGRGPTIDERSLYEALENRRIAGAIIDTWYNYPSPGQPSVLPSKFPFHELPNVVMTPHMSGWTTGTIHRRRQTIADNIARRAAGQTLRQRGEAGAGPDRRRDIDPPAYGRLDLWQTLATATAQESPTRSERGISWLSNPTTTGGGSYEIDALGTGAGGSCTHRGLRDGVGSGSRAIGDACARENRLVVDRKARRAGDHPRPQGLSEDLQGSADSCRRR